MTTPLFVLSLPRSGSTLLQRMLMAHRDISGVDSECWVLLPWLYARRAGGVRAEYDHQLASNGVRNMIDALPGKGADYEAIIRGAYEAFYGRLSPPSAAYFIDKTPFYYRIIDELIRTFPEARFIVLVRNPLSVLSSSIKTFSQDSLRRSDRIEHYLRRGPQLLAAGAQALGPKAHVVRYEALVQEPEAVLSGICAHLELEADPACWRDFEDQQVRMGDPHRNAYSGVVNRSAAWKDGLRTRVRQRLAAQYIKEIDQGYLDLCQLKRASLHQDLQRLPSAPLGLRDASDLGVGLFARWAKHKAGWLPRG